MASQVASPTMILGPTASPHRNFEEENQIQDESKDEKKEEGSNAPCSRHALKLELTRLSRALTSHEHGFLERLADHGDEVAVAKAREKLADASLFFEISQHHLNETHEETKSSVSAPTSTTTASGETSIPTAAPRARISSIGSDGSLIDNERRLEYLENRKKSQLHGQIWKAHERGMPLNRPQGRQSLTSGSSSGFAAHECGLPLNRLQGRHSVTLGSSSAFAAAAAAAAVAAASPQPPIIPAKAGILRSTSVLSASPQERASEEAKIFRPSTANEQYVPQPPPPIPAPVTVFARGFSDGSRKSVTFNDIKQFRLYNRRASVDLPLPSARPSRMSRSISATEGIDLDALFGSSNSILNSSSNSLLDTSSNTARTFPPIKHPRHLDSFSSTPSLHMAHSIHSDGGSTANNSLVTNGTDTSIPAIRTAHPVHSDSLPDSALSWDMSEDSFNGVKDAFRKKYSQGWASPLAKNEELVMKPQILRSPRSSEQWQKPVLLRRASKTTDDEEGIEATEWEGGSLSSLRVDTLNNARMYSSLLSLADSTTIGSIRTAASYEERPTYDRATKDDIFRIRKSFSDDEVANIFLGVSRSLLRDTSSMYAEERPEDDIDDASWLDSEFSGGHFDSWNVLKDEYENGYGGGGTLPFRILGTSSDDVNAHPHVLSPPLLESLQNFLPWSLSESNFWMKYSMVRDGSSLHSMLQHIRGSKYTILAVETMDGEVFGSFTTSPWRKNWNFFGGGESFLWRMRHSRQEKCHSIVDQAHMESEIDVYPWTQENNCFQLCTHDRIAVGCGSGQEVEGEESDVKPHEWGFGLVLDSELLTGTTSPCATFGNPSLSTVHNDGTRFEIINLEVWTTTPCATLDDALKLELGQLFLESN